MFVGARVTKGVRYILAGFVNFGTVIEAQSISIPGKPNDVTDLSSLNFNFDYYDPVYDGYAASAGFVNGDVIVGLEKCEYVMVDNNEETEISNDRDPIITNANASTVARTKVLQRSIVQIDSDMTAEEWVDVTKSCEALLPQHVNTTMVVSRRLYETAAV